jgi:hypothetical protein
MRFASRKVSHFQSSELSIREQHLDRSGPAQGEVPPHKCDTLVGVAVAGLVRHRPHQGHPKSTHRDRRHQDADVSRTEFSVRPVEAKMPGTGQAGEVHHQTRRPVCGKADVPEEAFQPPIGRGDPNRTRWQARWLRLTVRALTMATIGRLKVSSRVLPSGTCGDSPEARTAIAGLAKGTFLCMQDTSSEKHLLAPTTTQRRGNIARISGKHMEYLRKVKPDHEANSASADFSRAPTTLTGKRL